MIDLFGHFQTILLFTHGHLAARDLSTTPSHDHSFMFGTNAFEALHGRGPHVFTELVVGLSDRQPCLRWMASVFRFLTIYSKLEDVAFSVCNLRREWIYASDDLFVCLRNVGRRL